MNETNEKTPDLLIEEHLPVKSKVAYGFANAANGALSGIVFAAITFFYNVKLGLSLDLIGWAWTIFAIWNAVNDPLLGILEERTKSPLGRRIPYIRYGAPIYGFLFILCWYPFGGTSQTSLFINLLLILFVFDTIYSMIGLVTYSLPAEMTLTQKARANLGVYSTLIGSIGMLVSNLVPIFLLTGDNSTNLNPAFRPTMVIIGIVSAAVLFLSSYGLTENKWTQNEEPLGFFDSIRETFKNKPFLIFEAGNFAFTLAQTILTSAIFYYVDYVLKISGLLSFLPLLLVFGMVFLMTFFFSWLVGKKGLKKVYLFGLIWTGVAFIITFFIGSQLITAIFGLMLVGIGLSAITVTGQPIMADIIDYDEVLTKKRRETTYSGVNALITKPAISIANSLFLAVISAFGFDEKLPVQTESAQIGILFGITIIPAIFLVICAIALYFYPLDGPKWRKQKEEIARIHNQKHQDYLNYLVNSGKIPDSMLSKKS